MLNGAQARARLAGRLPVYYGWVIFALANLPSFGARPVASVAVLSVFVILEYTFVRLRREIFQIRNFLGYMRLFTSG